MVSCVVCTVGSEEPNEQINAQALCKKSSTYMSRSESVCIGIKYWQHTLYTVYMQSMQFAVVVACSLTIKGKRTTEIILV